MTDLLARAETIKLAGELGVDPATLSFLGDVPAREIAALRRSVSRARFAKLEWRLKRLAASSKLLPVAATAKIAKGALGARLCGQVAGVIDVPTAVTFASQYQAPFLAELSVHLDPERVVDVMTAVPTSLAVAVGIELLRLEEHPTLARLVAVAPDEVAEAVIAAATPGQLVRIAFYVDDTTKVDEIMGRRSEAEFERLFVAALAEELFDQMLTVFAMIGAEQRARAVAAAKAAGPDATKGLIAAAERLDVPIPAGL